jgi:23S rRNA (guanosine2251-2'-O)-methyltransferase
VKISTGKPSGQERLYGVHLVVEALRARRRQVREVWIARGRDDRHAREIRELAEQQGIPVRQPGRAQLDREMPDAIHQGVVAVAGPLPLWQEDDLLAAAGPAPLLVILDGVEDPRNLGAVIRSAVAAGVDGILMSSRRSAPLSPVAARASAGGSERVRIGRCGNVAALLRRMRNTGTWTVGLDAGADRLWTDFDFRSGTALVVGGEGKGLRPLVRRTVDAVVRIPMAGGMESLNLAVATAVVLFEAVRQRGPSGGIGN